MDATKVDLIPRDTTLEAYRVQIQALRRLGPEGRLRMMLNFCDFIHDIARSGIRQRHPEYSEEQVKMAFIRLLYGEEIFCKVFPAAQPCPP